MPLGPFDDFDECLAEMEGRVDDSGAYCGWLEQQSRSAQVAPGGGVLPENYRPDDSDDVPAGRNCANCFFFAEGDGEDDLSWCMLWEAAVNDNFYCNAWASVERQNDGDDMKAGYKEKEKTAIDPADMVVVETFDADAEMLVTTDGRIRAATLVAIPAFVEANIHSLFEDEDDDRWYGVLAPEGVPTGDGRMFERGSIRWADLPLPLLWAKSMEGGHDGAVVVGTIESITRAGDLLEAKGRFDLGSEEGREAARQVRAGIQRGVSVDLDDVSLEIRVAAEMLDDLTVEVVASSVGNAFSPRMSLIASSVSDRPFPSVFSDPKLAGPTPLTVTDEGRVFGHLALWGTCHTGFGHQCVQPPTSSSGYAFFRTGVVLCNDGTEMPVGRITLDTTHAGRRFGSADTIAHYEHTGLGVAHVSAGEDSHGIWISGVVAPGVTEEQIARLRVSPLSGDWRSIGGQLELVAALAVNSPGFPVPRALVASGRVASLQASGVVRESDVLVMAASSVGLNEEETDALRALAQREVKARRAAKVNDAALKVAAAKVAARVRGAR